MIALILMPLCAAVLYTLWQMAWEDGGEDRVTQDEIDAAHRDCQQADELKRFNMACTRVQDYQRWRVRFREAEHERAIRDFRRMWDGCIG